MRGATINIDDVDAEPGSNMDTDGGIMVLAGDCTIKPAQSGPVDCSSDHVADSLRTQLDQVHDAP